MKLKLKISWKYAVPSALACLLLGIICCNVIITRYASGRCYENTEDIPFNNVGLLLGTSPWLKGGSPNLYFKYRIEAAARLYKAGKIKYLLLSGDNRKVDYNEPQLMKKALIELGVPGEAIYLDYAGLRTLDSVVRAQLVFGQDTFTVISQKFHNERALYLAHWNDIEAIAFNARDVDAAAGFKTMVREWFARVKVFIDLITNKQPKHLGEPVQIPSQTD